MPRFWGWSECLATLALLLGCVAVPRSGAAQGSDIGLSFTDSFTGEWHASNQNGDDTDDDYGALLNRLNLTGTTTGELGALTASVEVDSFYFIEPPTDDFRDDTVLARIAADYRLGAWHIVAGDYRLQLGRGIVVSLRKEADVGLDLALRGGRVEWAPNTHRLSVFAGRINPSRIDGVSQHAVDDVDDVMAGASWDVESVGDIVDVSVFGLYVEPEERLLDERDYTVSGGVSVEIPAAVDWLALYLEADAQERSLAGTSEQGYAGYLVADIFVGDTTFLVEGLWLDEFEQLGSRNTALGTRFQYNRPPTLERVEEEVLQNRDVLGSRLRIEHTFFDADLTVFVNGSVRVNEQGDPAELRQLHGYAGVDAFFGGGSSRLTFSGGYRDERQDDTQVRSLVHGELAVAQAVGDDASLHLDSVTERRTLVDDDFFRGQVITSLEWAGLGSLSFELGYDTQDPSPNVANTFYAGILTWQSLDWLDVRLTGGTQRGGIKCIAGVCRDFPEFAGFRGELVFRN